jgi:KUP system potassium uptake protein
MIAFLMLTWRRGAMLLEQARVRLRQPEDAFLQALLAAPPLRLPGTAAVFTAGTTGVPLALTHHLKHNRVLHERVLLISGLTTDSPYVDPKNRVKLIDMGGGLTRIVLFFGFMERPNVVEGLRLACTNTSLGALDPEQLTYYFRREAVVPSTTGSGMATWRKVLFATMHLNANRTAAYFGVPTTQVVEVGLEIEI